MMELIRSQAFHELQCVLCTLFGGSLWSLVKGVLILRAEIPLKDSRGRTCPYSLSPHGTQFKDIEQFLYVSKAGKHRRSIGNATVTGKSPVSLCPSPRLHQQWVCCRIAEL